MGWDAFVREVGEVMFKNAIVLPDQTPNQRLRLFLGYLPIIGPPSAWASLAEGGPPLLRHTSQPPPPQGGGGEIAFWEVPNYDDHCTVVIVIHGPP